jgi:hypothetical protein
MTSEASIVASPLASNATAASMQPTEGGVPPVTVIVASQVAESSSSSVADKMTGVAPTG